VTVEAIEYGGKRYAEVIWADTRVEKTTFFSPAESSFQFGLLAHEAGFVEPPHYHHEFERTIQDLQQMFVVQRGLVAVDLYADDGTHLREIVLGAGDGIALIQGVHAIRVLEDMQAISVKQGPFLGPEFDKIVVQVKA
jgi:anti-sigma factor ChrR (cupin superfamily)